MTIVDQKSRWEYDLWRVQTTKPLPAKNGTVRIGNGGVTRIDGDGRADLVWTTDAGASQKEAVR